MKFPADQLLWLGAPRPYPRSMASLLIAVIYLAFISMGLPDALLGSAWPAMRPQLGVPVSYAGFLTILMSSGTVVSSLLSNRLLRTLGTARLTVACTALTVAALFGFSFSSEFWHLCLWAIPYGLGAGSIDAALNSYVALHYKSRHMSWIHFCWGLGATAGPVVMGYCLTNGYAWTTGYWVAGLLQSGMVLLLLMSLPLWKTAAVVAASGEPVQHTSTREALRLPGVKNVLIAFFCYCSLESTCGIWASSYMVLHRGVEAAAAAKWASFFYLGITIGRFVLGFIADRVGNRRMVRCGQACAAVGAVLIMLPFDTAFTFAGLMLVGLGCAPIYPCLLHATPDNFGAASSQALIGVQMACAYTGSTLTPPLVGAAADVVDIAVYPYVLLGLIVVMTVMTERLNRVVDGRGAAD